jgi:hypothetical protein
VLTILRNCSINSWDGVAQVQSALEKSATDNLTVIVVCFSNDPPPSRGSSSSMGRTLSRNGLDTLFSALAIADADADMQRRPLQRVSSNFATRAGASTSSTAATRSDASGPLLCPQAPACVSKPPMAPHDKLGNRSLLS